MAAELGNAAPAAVLPDLPENAYASLCQQLGPASCRRLRLASRACAAAVDRQSARVAICPDGTAGLGPAALPRLRLRFPIATALSVRGSRVLEQPDEEVEAARQLTDMLAQLAAGGLQWKGITHLDTDELFSQQGMGSAFPALLAMCRDATHVNVVGSSADTLRALAAHGGAVTHLSASFGRVSKEEWDKMPCGAEGAPGEVMGGWLAQLKNLRSLQLVVQDKAVTEAVTRALPSLGALTRLQWGCNDEGDDEDVVHLQPGLPQLPDDGRCPPLQELLVSDAFTAAITQLNRAAPLNSLTRLESSFISSSLDIVQLRHLAAAAPNLRVLKVSELNAGDDDEDDDDEQAPPSPPGGYPRLAELRELEVIMISGPTGILRHIMPRLEVLRHEPISKFNVRPLLDHPTLSKVHYHPLALDDEANYAPFSYLLETLSALKELSLDYPQGTRPREVRGGDRGLLLRWLASLRLERLELRLAIEPGALLGVVAASDSARTVRRVALALAVMPDEEDEPERALACLPALERLEELQLTFKEPRQGEVEAWEGVLRRMLAPLAEVRPKALRRVDVRLPSRLLHGAGGGAAHADVVPWEACLELMGSLPGVLTISFTG